MPQSKKLSPQSSFARFMVGSIMTAFGTARLMRNPRSRSAQGLVVLGAMQAAQGATGYCPTKGMMGNLLQNSKMSNLTQTAGNMAQKMTGGTMQQATNAVQNAVPEVGQLMKDFSNAITGTTGGKSASASSGQTGTTSGSSQSGTGTKAAASNTNTSTNNTKAASSYKDGTPSDQMMKEVADKVISAASKNTHSPQIH